MTNQRQPEDAALDRVLAAASQYEPGACAASRALVDRVIARAVTERASATASDAGDERVVALRHRETTAALARPPRRAAFEVAALLAASLVAGIFIGGQSGSLAAVQDLAGMIGFSADAGEVFQVLASDDQITDSTEDPL